MIRTRVQRGFTLIEVMVVVVIIGILVGLAISMSSRTYGANAKNISEQLSSAVNYARTRALSTRRIHRLEFHPDVSPAEIRIYAAQTTGMALSNYTGGTPTYVTRITLPRNITLWSGVAGNIAAGSSPTQSTTEYDVTVYPDGQSTASTIYVSDNKDKYRVLIFHVTGSAYARQGW